MPSTPVLDYEGGGNQNFVEVVPTLESSFNATVSGLTGGTGTLESVSTNGLATLSMISFVVANELQQWQLQVGAADPANPTGEVAPLDYDAGTNNRKWVRVA